MSAFGTGDGTATNARFAFPHGLSVAANGDVYLADGVGTVRKIAAGVVSAVAGSSSNWGTAIGSLPGSFTSPTGVVVVPSASGTRLMLNMRVRYPPLRTVSADGVRGGFMLDMTWRPGKNRRFKSG